MKMIKNATAALMSIAAVVAMTACSSDSDTPFVSGKLATGGFIKTVEEAGGSSFGGMFGTSDSRYQLLYTPTDIEGSGNIESIGFQLFENVATGVNCPNVTIKIGHTSLAALTTTYDSNVEVGQGSRVTAASNVNLTIPSGLAGEYFSIPLDAPFNYNGVDNLIVEVVRDVACDTAVLVNGSIAAYNASLYATNFTAATGTTSTAQIHMKAIFAGGVNTQEYGGSSGHSLPFNLSNLAHLQNLYMASDVNGSGPITGIGLQMNGSSVESTYTLTVKIGHSSLTDLQAVYADNSSDFKAVATDVNITVPAGLVAGDWVWIPLEGSFNYNGTDNLLVDFETTAAVGGDNYVRATSMSNNVRASGSDGSTTALNVDTWLNNAKFRFNGATMDVITPGDDIFYAFYGNNAYTRQYLYSAHSMGTGGAVTEVVFRLEYDSLASDYPAAEIVLGHTDNTSLDTNMSLNMDDRKFVFNGTMSIPAGLKAGDWVTFPVSGFTYDPTKNLVVEVSQDTGDNTNILRGTTTDMPGASGWVIAYRGNDISFNGQSGHVDLRIKVNK